MTDLVMPKFGLTMTEGLLSEWHVAPGEAFKAGQLLFSVETEKVANEVEAEADGVLGEVLVSAGETVPVGALIARIDGSDEATPPTPVPADRSEPSHAPRASGADIQDAPTARKLMAEHGLSRAELTGSGRGGRVMKDDVMRVIATPLARRKAAEQGIALEQIEGSGARGRIKVADVEKAAEMRTAPAPATVVPTADGTEITPDAARLATAHRVTASKQDIPHFYVTHEAEVSALTDLRKQLNAGEGRIRISVTHMLVRAMGIALAELPSLNRIWAGDRIISFDRADIGMVVETPAGLRIPVLRDVGAVDLDAIAEQANAAAERARNGALSTGDVGDSVIAISNVGMFGVSSLTPIINPPNAMILGVGADRKLFRPDADGAPVLRHELTLTLAADHRIIDGADAARFLAHLAHIIEDPLRLLRAPQTT